LTSPIVYVQLHVYHIAIVHLQTLVQDHEVVNEGFAVDFDASEVAAGAKCAQNPSTDTPNFAVALCFSVCHGSKILENYVTSTPCFSSIRVVGQTARCTKSHYRTMGTPKGRMDDRHASFLYKTNL